MGTEALGMHSAWIGEWHFSTLGILYCPDIVLGYVARVIENLRLAPEVTTLSSTDTPSIVWVLVLRGSPCYGRIPGACGGRRRGRTRHHPAIGERHVHLDFG